MGEYADMIIEGLVDQYTGEFIDGDAPGYPRSMHSKFKKKKTHTKKDGTFRCEKCGKFFKTEQGVEHHNRDLHTPEGQERRRRQRDLNG